MALEVIGAGLGRTGTMSLKVALEQLGFGPCHHMTELPKHPERWPLWEGFFEGQPVDWNAVFEGYKSTVDAPSCFVYRELAEFYPEAKVILTVRDPERWFESTLRTIAAPGYREKLAQTPIGKLTRLSSLRQTLLEWPRARQCNALRERDCGDASSFGRPIDVFRRRSYCAKGRRCGSKNPTWRIAGS